jgi:hypothetical protein
MFNSVMLVENLKKIVFYQFSNSTNFEISVKKTAAF